MSSREGACISSAYDDMMSIFENDGKRGNAFVVHGWVYSHKLNATIKHAWIAFNDKEIIYEPVKQVILDKNMQELLKMKEVKRYSYWDIIKKSLKTGMKGGVFEF